MRRKLGIALRAGVLAGLVLAGGAWARMAYAHPERSELEQAVGKMLIDHPDDPELILKQGRLREMAKDWDGALAAIEHARDHGAAAEVVGAARGRVFHAAGFPRMAKVEYDRVLALRPDAFELLFERGRVQLLLGQADEADADFAQAIAHMATPRPEHVIERRDALVAHGKREEALAALDGGIARLGPVVSLELPAVDLDLELGRHDEALQRIDRLLAQSPTNAAWIARRGEILVGAGRATQAQAEFARALDQLRARPGAPSSTANTELEARLRAALTPDTIDARGSR